MKMQRGFESHRHNKIKVVGRGKCIKKTCKHCSAEFNALVSKIKQGGGLYCTVDCYKKSRQIDVRDIKITNILYQKKYKYGLNSYDYFELFNQQNNKCGICGVSFNEVEDCVDHSHKTGKVRGLLCDKCNRGLGFFKESVENLQNAIFYLNRTI